MISKNQPQASPELVGNIVTTVGDPGTDTNIPSEKAVRDAINAIPTGATFSGVRLYKTDEYVIPAQNDQFTLNWQTELFDTDNYHSGTATTITIPSNGYYAFGVNITFYPGASIKDVTISSSEFGIECVDRTNTDNAVYNEVLSTSSIRNFTAGTTLTVQVRCLSGGKILINNYYEPQFWCYKIG